MYSQSLAVIGRVILIGLLARGLSVAAHAGSVSAVADPLTLAEVEQLALSNNPLLPRFNALASAQQERAVAEAQLPDPKLRLGLQNLPTDTFSRNQDDMTQAEIGVQQSFPAGNTLRYRSDQATALAAVEQARAADEARKTLQAVRTSWLEVHYQTEAAELVRQTQTLFKQVVQATQAQYGTGDVTQQDVLGAELELNLLKDRETSIEAARETALAELGKRIGTHHLTRRVAQEFPQLATPGTHDDILVKLDVHPAMQAEDGQIRSNESEVDVARAQYKPSWEVDLSYGQRSSQRADMVSAMVTMDLPIFTDKRQDRRLAASQQEVYAARYARDDRRRELQHMLEVEYTAWTRLGERLAHYDKTILPQATQNAEAALNAYQSASAGFANVAGARVTELESRLQALRLRVDRAKAQANLLYLSGEPS